MAKRKKKTSEAKKVFHVIQPDAAGIDVGATEIYVAIPDDRSEKQVRCFKTFTQDLHEAAKWMRSNNIQSVVMESTGVYWIPIFQILESYGFEVFLVNARHVKNVPGRKTDVQDCQWLQYLHSVGLLRGSYRPAQEVCAVRSLLRHRDSLIKTAASHTQHMQKALTQMNLQIHNVISDITGVTGLAILDAILSGERSPGKLADLKDRRIRADRTTIVKSLEGDYRSEHIFTLQQSLDSYRHYKKQVDDCDLEIEKLLQEFESRLEPPEPLNKRPPKKTNGNEPKFDLRGHLHRIFGVDLTEINGISSITAHVLFSEIGVDLSAFPNARCFCSWLGLCPNNKISGGKILSSGTKKTSNRAAQALRLAARSLWNSQCFLGNYFRRMRSRHGTPKAITSVAHKLARIVYHLLTTGQSFDESVFAEEEKQHKKRLKRRLEKQAKSLGFKLVAAGETV